MDIVLIGGGHAHVEVLRSALMTPVSGARLTLVTRDVATPYSGMIPGYLAGLYTRTEAHIDLVPLAALAGARMIHAAATGLDPEARQVHFEDRPPPSFLDVALAGHRFPPGHRRNRRGRDVRSAGQAGRPFS